MQRKITVDIALFHLFIHDYEPGCRPFDETSVEEAINKELSAMNSDYELVCADSIGGRRWKYVDLSGTNMPSSRPRNVEQVKEMLPDDLVSQLEDIDRDGISLD